MSGVRHLRKLVSRSSYRVVRLNTSQYTDAPYTDVQYTEVAEPEGSDHTNLVRLDRSQYTEVR